MANRDSNIANFYETTLSASMGATDLTATVVTTTGGPASPCYVIIEPESASQREVIYMDGTFTSTTFVTSTTANRYLDGSAAGSGLTHPSGSVVWVAVLAQHLEDIHDRIDTVSDHGTLTGLADDDHTQYLNTARHNALDHTTALGTASITDLADVDTTGAAANDALVFDGTNWGAGTSGAQITASTYTGDGAAARTISLAFTPKTVTIWQSGTRTQFLNDTFAHDHTGAAVTAYPASKTTTNGFIVDNTTDNNTSGTTYHYVAIG